MCGLTGVFGNLSNHKQNIEFFHNLLIVNQLRGNHSTGVAKLRKSKAKPLIHKTIGDPATLFCEQKYLDMVQDQPEDLLGLLGHGRHATKGEISYDNAHPFRHGHITVTHNGTVWYTGTEEEFGTDSEAITFNISKNGIDEAWQAIRGAAALVWWNAAEQTLNMVTNGERPLAYLRTKDERIFWASESGALRYILTQRQAKVEIADPGIMILRPHFMFTWKFFNGKLEKSVRELPKYQPIFPISNVVQGVFRPKSEKKTTIPVENVPIDKVLSSLSKYGLKRPAQTMNYLAFSSGTRQCAVCTEVLMHQDFGQGVAAGTEEFVCKVCSDLYFVIGWENYFAHKGSLANVN